MTANKDFVPKDQLRAELQPEVPDGVGLAAYRSTFRSLRFWAPTTRGVSISLEELQRRATPTVVQLVPLTFVIPRAIFGSASNDRDYESMVEKAKPVRVKAARRWANDEEGLTVVDSEWELVVSSARFPRFSDGPAESDEDVQLRGTIQHYLLDASGEEQPAQIVGTRIAGPGLAVASWLPVSWPRPRRRHHGRFFRSRCRISRIASAPALPPAPWLRRERLVAEAITRVHAVP